MQTVSRVVLVFMLASMIGVEVDPAWLNREGTVSRTATWTDRVATTIRASARPVTPSRVGIADRPIPLLPVIGTRSLAAPVLLEPQLHLPPPAGC